MKTINQKRRQFIGLFTALPMTFLAQGALAQQTV